MTKSLIGLNAFSALLLSLACTAEMPVKPTGSDNKAEGIFRDELVEREITDNDADSISIPVNISGTFLFCQEQDGEASQQVQCKAASALDAPKVALETYSSAWRFEVQEVTAGEVTIESQENPPESAWHFTANFSGQDQAVLKSVVKKTQIKLSLLQIETGGLQFSAALPGGFSNGLLPDDFRIFVGALGVSNSPYPSAREVVLPTSNLSYPDLDGCYMACYSNDPSQAVYQVGPDVYVKGQLRVQGAYQGRICEMPGRERENLVNAFDMRQQCGKYISSCGSSDCWVGGDTGGWFGIDTPPPQVDVTP